MMLESLAFTGGAFLFIQELKRGILFKGYSDGGRL